MSFAPANALQDAVIEKGATLNITDCIKLAIQNSPNVKKYRYNYNISKKNINIAKSAYFPTIGLGTGYYMNNNSSSDWRNTNSNYLGAQASLNQMIFNFGKTWANIKMQKFNTIAAKYNFDYTVLDTIYGVKTNYYGVLAAKANVDVQKANVQINERNYQRTKAYFDEGIKSKIDLVNAEVYLSDSKVTLVEAEKTYKNALIKLNNSMYVARAPEYEIATTESFNIKSKFIPVSFDTKNEDISSPPEPVKDAVLTTQVEKTDVLTDYKFTPFPYTLEECQKLAEEKRPDLMAYEATLKAMEQSLLATKREYYPSLGVQGGYNFRNTNNINSFNLGLALSTSVNIMQTKNEIDSAKIQVDLAQNEIDLLKQNIYFEIQDNYVNMVQLEKQIPLLAVKVRQTLENLELADGRYFVGIGDYIELQDAKVNYNNAQQSYVQAVYNYNVARANLEKSIALEDDLKVNIEDKN